MYACLGACQLARSVESGVWRTLVGRMVALWVPWWHFDLQGLVLPKPCFLVIDRVFGCACVFMWVYV